jgi:hypothetical protein
LISDIRKETTADGQVDYNAPSGNPLLVGNFSYYPRPTEEGGMWMSQQRQDCMGYTLAGYGSVRTPGQDVYNRNGNYRRYRTENCEGTAASAAAQVLPGRHRHLPGDNSFLHLKNNGGSDTPGGVVVTLDSGVDRSSKRTNIGVTEGDFSQVSHSHKTPAPSGVFQCSAPLLALKLSWRR